MSASSSFDKDKKHVPDEHHIHQQNDGSFNKEAEWWNQNQTRRKNIGTIVTLGIGTAIVGGVVLNEVFSDDDEQEQETDSLQLQQKEGWDIGADTKVLSFPGSETSVDSKKEPGWKAFLSVPELLKAYEPKNPAYMPFMVPTLIQALKNPTLVSKIKLYTTGSINNAYSRGLGMREIIKKTTNPQETMYIVDVDGPESIAFGAAIADVADPIITFDNWPHPIGVVPSHLTLSTMLFFAKEIKEKSSLRPKNAPAVFLLDKKRFIPNINPDTQFDNRYVAKIPSIENLKQMNIKNVLYFVPDRGTSIESDDLNADFTNYKSNGVEIQMVPMTDFVQSYNEVNPNGNIEPEEKEKELRTGGYYDAQPTYYYGGSTAHMAFFFMNYSMMHPSYTIVSSRLPASRVSAPSYRPTTRSTIFSSKSVSSAKGIGRSKPSGFGTVTTRTSRSSGRVSGVRAGGHGSFGRGGSSGG